MSRGGESAGKDIGKVVATKNLRSQILKSEECVLIAHLSYEKLVDSIPSTELEKIKERNVVGQKMEELSSQIMNEYGVDVEDVHTY